MALDPQTLTQMLKLNPQQAQRLTTAWGAAQQLAAGVNNKNEAVRLLASKGIGQDTLQKVNRYLNNPIASMLASAAGVDISGIKNMLQELQQPSTTMNNIPATSATSTSSLDRLRAGLQQLKR